MSKVYKEPIDETEKETTINVLYGENCLAIYTNKAELQKQLCKIFGEPNKEHKKGKAILGSTWIVSLDDKSKITKMMLQANIFEL